jgi:hypothetical protein
VITPILTFPALLGLLAAAPTATKGAAELKLTLDAAKSTILVGEGEKVTLTWRSTGPVAIMPDLVTVLLDDGTGFRPYQETRIGTASSLWVGDLIVKPCAPFRTAYVLAVSGQMRSDGARDFKFAFPKAGRYQIKTEYRQGAKAVLSSNTIVITVRPPDAADKELFELELRKRPDLLTEWSFLDGMDADAETVKRLLQEHGASPYLSRVQVLYWQHELRKAAGRGGSESELRTLLDRIEESRVPGPFDEDRLLLVARNRAARGDSAGAARAFGELRVRYPDSEPALQAAKWTAEHGSPLPRQ